MNKIKISYVKTIYNYLEYCWTIDDKLIVEYLDFYTKKGLCPKLKSMGTMMGLMNAWTGQLLWKPDNDFIWELIDCKQDINLPILVCEDDCDLNCIVIMVSIRKTDKFVYWDKIGLLNHENEDFDKKKQSGILYLDAYTEEDWEKYGDNIATENYNSHEYKKWVSENWEEEIIRRHRNYTKPYMQQNGNIYWIKNTNWKFDINKKKKMVEQYRKIYILNKSK